MQEIFRIKFLILSSKVPVLYHFSSVSDSDGDPAKAKEYGDPYARRDYLGLKTTITNKKKISMFTRLIRFLNCDKVDQ